ncbi:unnamed protein product [Moneuplotes crassus]|uniref:Uncharacterized protein n=1 Tax=Euplotes crassus TaxID=5936 RepID=A0AAD1X8C9_EUPCR|nr:unnamed protein product [Moneuplotes crassus]
MLLLLLILPLVSVFTRSCSEPMTKEVFTFDSGARRLYILNVFIGQTGNQYVQAWYVTAGGVGKTLIMKIYGGGGLGFGGTNNDILWSKAYQRDHFTFLIDMMPDESALFYHWGSLILKIRTSDGVLDKTMNNPFCVCSGNDATVIAHNSYVFINCKSVGTISGKSTICKMDPNTLNLKCLTATDIHEYSVIVLPLSSNSIFISGHDSNPSSKLILKKINFSSNSISWENYINCPNGSCEYGVSKAVYVQSKDSILIGSIFGTPKQLVLLELDQTNRITSKIIIQDCNQLWRMKTNNVNVIGLNSGSTGTTLFKYNPEIKEIKSIKLKGSTVYFRDLNFIPSLNGAPFEDKIQISGGVSSVNLYIISAEYDYIEFHADFVSNVEIKSSKLNLSETNYILNSDSSSALVLNSTTLSATSVSEGTNFNRIYSPGLLFQTKIHHNLTTEVFNLTENTNGYVELNLTYACDSSNVSFELTENTPSSYPNWINFYSNNGSIAFETPEGSNLTYSAAISTLVTGWEAPRNKLVYFSVDKCKVSNCVRCSPTNSYKCEECDLYYEGYECDKMDLTAVSTTAKVANGILGLSIAIIIISSLVSMQSPVAVWVLVNHLQILLLLLLMKAYIPTQIVEFLTNSNFALINFDSAGAQTIPYIGKIYDIFGRRQSNENILRMGFAYESSFQNNIDVMLSLFFIVCINCFSYCMSKLNLDTKQSKCKKCCKFVINRFHSLMAFNAYIRLFLEAYLALSLTSISEIVSFRIKESESLISLVISLIILFCCLALMIFCYIHVLLYKPYKPDFKSRIDGLYSGIKSNKLAILFPSVCFPEDLFMSHCWSFCEIRLQYSLLAMFCQSNLFILGSCSELGLLSREEQI